MSGVKERLVRFIEYKGLSKNKFEKVCGFSPRYVSNISQSIQPDKVERISINYPDLNTGWLLTGEGEMLKGETKPETKVEEYLRIIASQQETIARLSCVIERLTQKRERDALTA